MKVQNHVCVCVPVFLQMPRDGCDGTMVPQVSSLCWAEIEVYECIDMHWQMMESERQELKQDSDLVRRIVQDCGFRISSREVLNWNCQIEMEI